MIFLLKQPLEFSVLLIEGMDFGIYYERLSFCLRIREEMQVPLSV